jgi:glutamine synthetase
VHMLARTAGMTATFMPKPFTARTGSGMHLHLSLWTGAEPAFPDPADARGLGLSSTAYSFVAGLLDHSRGLHALIAPTVNSYKRTGAATTTSGATWAPKGATYGGNDRTHFVRVPDGNRVELRGGDGSANPYLAIAGALSCGLAGIRAGADPGEPGRPGIPAIPTTKAAPALPRTLLEAADAFAADPVTTAALDAGLSDWAASGGLPPAEAVSAYFARQRTEEFFAWHDTVSTWETDRYLTAF